MATWDVIIIGGGAAGFFSACQLRTLRPQWKVLLLENTSKTLQKVRISGGGRCNVTHSCFEPKNLVKHYPRGERELLGPFHSFQPEDTLKWFGERGVEIVREEDGRMFPRSNTSSTIVECLHNGARGVEILKGVKVDSVDPGFSLSTSEGEFKGERLILATGSSPSGHTLAKTLGHTIVPPVPSLFSMHVSHPLLHDLAGLAFKEVTVSLKTSDGKKFSQSGPMLITHKGLSGPAILKLSAWAARSLEAQKHRAQIRVAFGKADWDLPATTTMRKFNPGLPRRFWERVLEHLKIEKDLQLANLSKKSRNQLEETLCNCEFPVDGKTLNKEEFVTCGGISSKEVNFKTMESRKVPCLYFAGEILDIDGVTGGFNFQNAWTGAFLATQAMSQ